MISIARVTHFMLWIQFIPWRMLTLPNKSIRNQLLGIHNKTTKLSNSFRVTFYLSDSHLSESKSNYIHILLAHLSLWLFFTQIPFGIVAFTKKEWPNEGSSAFVIHPLPIPLPSTLNKREIVDLWSISGYLC